MSYDFDFLVIGGGSGGVSSAKRAASYGARVAIVEANRWGGTCVNVGCVPKKIMYQAATMSEIINHEAKQYEFKTTGPSKIDWKAMKEKRDKYILRLNGIYLNGLKNSGVTVLEGWASFVDSHTVKVDMNVGTTKTVTADKIVIATGGKPYVPGGEGVNDKTIITSDGFFELDYQPDTVAVVGAGYIAVELAGVFNALGTKTHLVLRHHKALRSFDEEITDFLDKEMVKSGMTIHRNTGGVAKIEVVDGKKRVTCVEGQVIDGVDVVLMAPGRVPDVEGLSLDKAGVKVDERKKTIVVDDFQTSSVENIFALGDVAGLIELTPMAIAAGRRLADRLFGNMPNAKTSYENVPTVIFSHPTIGSCGLTEEAAMKKYGADNIKVYRSTFVNLYYAVFDMDPSEKPKTFAKIICAGVEEQVVGLHMIGMGADEIMQGFGVAMKMGATKADFDSCIAIHPTAAEELVTMGVWGTSPQHSGAKVPPLMGAAAPEPTLKSKM